MALVTKTFSEIITFGRTTNATYFNSAGLLTLASAGTPRFDYNPATLAAQGLLIEEQRVNLLTYSSEFDGAAWTKGNATVAVNVTTSPTGNVEADKLVEDTANSTHFVRRTVTGTVNTAPITISVYVKAAGRTYIGLAIQEATTFTRQTNVVFDLTTVTSNTPTNLGGAGSASATITNVGNGWYRCTLTTTLGGTDTNVYGWIYAATAGGFTYTGDGTSGIYLYGAQLEAGAFATSYAPSVNTFTSRSTTGSYFDSAGVLQSAAINVARNTYNPANLAAQPFLLLEEARTNGIRNNTMVGAVAGTPGTPPTNWTVNLSGSGVTQQIIGTGTEDGITYIDIKFSGTGSGGVIPQINTETSTQIVAATGQTWAASYYLRIVGGSATGCIGTFQQIWQERDAAGVSLTTVGVIIADPTTAALRTQRNILTRTLTNAGTARLTNRIQWVFTDGVAVDITLRIGLPQLELGAYATSVIPTTTTALTRAADLSSSAQATRAADIASVNTLSPWYNQSEGTVYAELQSLSPLTSAQSVAINKYPHVWHIDAGATDSSVFWYGLGAELFIGGTYNNLSVVPSGINKLSVALAASGGQSASSLNGAAAVNRSGTLTGTATLFSLGKDSTNNANNFLNGWLRRLTYYPRALTGAELASL